ncbi:MAG: class I SAM-dependent RNA methyltransferase [Acidobacteria bacterium]|nr:class I SAM-dependent RNA methyltransferase [Acidobacteriota bacterium]
MAPFVLPGERIEARVIQSRNGFTQAVPEVILTPSPERIDAPCPHFSRCGGCHLQHAGYTFQVAAKRDILREVLARVGRVEAPEEIRTVTGEPWGYRNRIQLHFQNGRMGFLEAGTHTLRPISNCPVASPMLNTAIGALERMTHNRRWPRFIRSIELFTNETQVQLNVLETGAGVSRGFFTWCGEVIPGADAPSLEYVTGRDTFRVSHGAFFQVNRHLIDALVDLACGEETGRFALDLYAGVGLFSLPLSRRFERAEAVESGRLAAAGLRFNAERAAVPLHGVQLAAEAYLAALDTTPDFILADPPRAGLGRDAVQHLLRLRAPRLRIVSCDPATLARDLAALLAGGYAIEEQTLIDLFPQTFHVETVTTLVLR